MESALLHYAAQLGCVWMTKVWINSGFVFVVFIITIFFLFSPIKSAAAWAKDGYGKTPDMHAVRRSAVQRLAVAAAAARGGSRERGRARPLNGRDSWFPSQRLM